MSRLPLPTLVLSAIADRLVQLGEVKAAIALKLGESAYLRPGELCSLKRYHPVPLAPEMGIVHWGFLLHPEGLGVASKTGQCNDTILLDGADTPLLPDKLPDPDPCLLRLLCF